jgi:hypothetical protein
MSNNDDQMGDLMDKVNSLSDLKREEEARQELEKARIILEEKYNLSQQAVPETSNGN